MNTVSRREIKYLINIAEYKKNKNYLEKILIQDEHNKTNGYKVRSLYFDTLDDRDFCEKENGIEFRRKIRIRVYDPDDSFAMLEMKQKEGNYQKKRSLRITKEDAIKMINGDYSCLLSYNSPFASEMYTYMTVNCYRPKVVIEYDRTAFMAKENNIRITFDHNILATESSFDIFDKKLLMTPVMDRANVILEVKYNGFLLSYIKNLIKNISVLNISVSKYYLSRNVSHKVIL